MSDVNLVNFPITASTTTDANAVAEALYEPATAATSFAEINGEMVNANRQSGWDIRSNQIRNRSMADGRMVGATGTLDYGTSIFASGDSAGATVIGNEEAVPGCSINFYLPISPSIVFLTWQTVAAWNGSGTLRFEERLHVNGARELDYFRALPAAVFTTRQEHRDRVWAGSWASTALTAGWQSAAIRIWSDAGNGNSDVMLRLRTRNMKVFWIR